MSFATLAYFASSLFLAQASLPAVPDFACDSSDTACWKRMVLWYRGQHASVSELLVLERKRSSELEQSSNALRLGFEKASALAEKLGNQALSSREVPWHSSPHLWSGVTAVVVASLAIGIAQGFKISLNGR